MTKSLTHSCVSLAALGMAMAAVPAFAADAPAQPAPAAAPAPDVGGLDTIVVTASGRDKTKLKSSISVSSVSNQQIQDFTPRSEAEVLRTIPGLNLQDTAGPGGNSNIGVRGLPVSTGGSEYVALQEDGLPVTLFGDIQFGNNDYYIRFDNSVDRVEAVRGGSAATFASQAPGAIINYISKTGEKEGGSIGISTGVNYKETRVDYDLGAKISDTLRFHIGGFFKDGSGVNHIGYNAVNGYQIKANITKDFADGKGYFRFNFKRLDDKEPTNTSQPSQVSLSGGTITGFSTFDGVDARQYSSAGIYNQSFQILDGSGNVKTVNNEGIHPKTTSFGGEFHYEFSSNFTVNDNFRWADQTSAFGNQWTGETTTASVIGSTVNGGKVGSIVYAAGPNKGKVYTGTYMSNSAQAYEQSDTGSLANDLTLNGKFDAGNDLKLNVKAGWFHMRQTIAADWRINNYSSTLNSSNDSAPLDYFTGANGTGTQLSANGITGYNNQWGGCCGGRVYNTTYTNDAPYLNLDTKVGKLDLDGSIRFDSVKASGYSYGTTKGKNVTVTDGLGSASVETYNTDFSKYADLLNYTVHYTSWSLGALFEVDKDTSVFGRVSRGGRFNADRLLYGGNFNADGSLNDAGRAKSVNFVTQQELGIKHRGDAAGGRYSVEATFYRAQVGENNYDFTKQIAYNTTYHSHGVETYANMNWGGFRLDGSVVYTHARRLDTDKTPHTMPEWTYRLSPSYDAGMAAIGFTLNGQTSAWAEDDNVTKIPGSSFVNAFVKARPMPGIEAGLNVNNLFNTLGYRGSGGLAAVNSTGTQALFDNSAVAGRSISASVKYKF